MELDLPPWHVYNLVPFPAVVSDPIMFLKLVHQEYVCYSLGDIPHIESPEQSHLVCNHRSRVTVDFDSVRERPNTLQVPIALEGSNH